MGLCLYIINSFEKGETFRALGLKQNFLCRKNKITSWWMCKGDWCKRRQMHPSSGWSFQWQRNRRILHEDYKRWKWKTWLASQQCIFSCQHYFEQPRKTFLYFGSSWAVGFYQWSWSERTLSVHCICLKVRYNTRRCFTSQFFLLIWWHQVAYITEW